MDQSYSLFTDQSYSISLDEVSLNLFISNLFVKKLSKLRECIMLIVYITNIFFLNKLQKTEYLTSSLVGATHWEPNKAPAK